MNHATKISVCDLLPFVMKYMTVLYEKISVEVNRCKDDTNHSGSPLLYNYFSLPHSPPLPPPPSPPPVSSLNSFVNYWMAFTVVHGVLRKCLIGVFITQAHFHRAVMSSHWVTWPCGLSTASAPPWAAWLLWTACALGWPRATERGLGHLSPYMSYPAWLCLIAVFPSLLSRVFH